MRTFSSAHAKNHFGELIDAARIAPVAVTKYDKPFVVVMGVEEFESLKSRALEKHPALETLSRYGAESAEQTDIGHITKRKRT